MTIVLLATRANVYFQYSLQIQLRNKYTIFIRVTESTVSNGSKTVTRLVKSKWATEIL